MLKPESGEKKSKSGMIRAGKDPGYAVAQEFLVLLLLLVLLLVLQTLILIVILFTILLLVAPPVLAVLVEGANSYKRIGP